MVLAVHFGVGIVQDMIGDQTIYFNYLCCHWICAYTSTTKFGLLQEYTCVAILIETEAIYFN